ncbi:MAG TPA: hypothetical protein DEB39_06640 [Planctomycetaceae bacterium]|nr:hypothetical protein [Planctomycetaceae bacterium]
MPDLYAIGTEPAYVFVRLALLVSAMGSVSFGLVGTFVVVRRIGYLAGAIAHCAFGGIGIGLYLQHQLGFASVDPLGVALLVSVACAVLIGIVNRCAGEREDTIIGVIWAVGMAVGLLCLDKVTAGNVNISAYLFGDLYLVSEKNLYAVAFLGLVVLATTLLCFHRLQAVAFDEEHTRLRGIPTTFYFQLLLVLASVTVVLMVQVVGMILVVAMLTLPAAAAGRLTRRLFPMAVLAVLFCFLFSWTGIYLSLWGNFSSGPMIIVVAAVGYAIALFVGRK